MILQNIIMPDSTCGEQNLFYQADECLRFENEVIKISAKKEVSFFSYMNIFDADAWKKYTWLKKVTFRIAVKGDGVIHLKSREINGDEFIASFYAILNSWSYFFYEINLEQTHGCYYIEVQTESEVLIKDACFMNTDVDVKKNDIKLAINTCTYQRNREIQRNLKQLKHSKFFCYENEFYQKLQIIVVDNGSDLDEINEPYVKVVHNPNNGGAGGFKRGLEEIRSCQKDISHVVFIDDDVEFQLESFYRTYALLSYIRPKYKCESIAGRMFRTDCRQVQYTAAEIWNNGDLLHIGLNEDMTLKENILKANKNENAEYGGWWFCCYPMEFAKNNDPLPFFIHCDDVEYGLRHGGTPIILNGIQVWHETYEYRQNPIIAYYDMRNSLIVNELYNLNGDKEKVLNSWKEKISQARVNKDYLTEYMMIRGMWDYLKGIKWLKRSNHTLYHKKLYKAKTNRYINALLWKITELKFRKCKM